MRVAGCPHELTVAEHDGHHVLHVPRAGVTCLVNRAMHERLRRLHCSPGARDPEVLAELEPLGLLDPPPPIPPPAIAELPSQLTIAVTRRCSLRCSYCYAHGGDSSATLPAGAAARAVGRFARSAAEAGVSRFAVHVHGGGDPGMAWDRVRELSDAVAEAAARHRLPVRRTLGINGVLSPRRTRWAAASFDELTVSVDGGPAVHDAQRPTTRGGPSLPWVERTLAELDDAGARYGVRMTVTADSVAAMAASVATICERCRAPVIQVEPAAALGRHAAARPIRPREFVEAFRQAAAVAAAEQRMLRYSAASYPSVREVFCRSLTDGACLQPEGTVTACYEAPADPGGRFTIGRWDPSLGRISLDQERRRRLLADVLARRRRCHGCIAEAHCAGDCPMKEGGAAVDRCAVNRALVLDQIVADLQPRTPRLAEA